MEKNLVVITNLVGPINFAHETFHLRRPNKIPWLDLISGSHETCYGVGPWHTPHRCATIDKSITSSLPQKRLDHSMQFWQGHHVVCSQPASRFNCSSIHVLITSLPSNFNLFTRFKIIGFNQGSHCSMPSIVSLQLIKSNN
jgi:hypothetical protein